MTRQPHGREIHPAMQQHPRFPTVLAILVALLSYGVLVSLGALI